MVKLDKLNLKEGDAVLVFREDGSADAHLSSDDELCNSADTKAFITMLLWGATRGWAVELRETLESKFEAEVEAEVATRDMVTR